jgi:hypothetical protein
MNGNNGRVGAGRRLHALAAYLAGIAVETLYTLCLAGIGALIVLGFLLLPR